MRLWKINYVGPCKACGSNRTGKFIYRHATPFEEKNIELEHLKKGEYVRIYKPYYAEHNCFCYDCGRTWHQDNTTKRVSLKEKREYIKQQKADAPIEEYRNMLSYAECVIKYTPKHHFHINTEITQQIGTMGKNAIKSFAYNMLYMPTIGTVKDILGIKNNSIKHAPQPTEVDTDADSIIDQLYQEYCLDDQENNDDEF